MTRVEFQQQPSRRDTHRRQREIFRLDPTLRSVCKFYLGFAVILSAISYPVMRGFFKEAIPPHIALLIAILFGIGLTVCGPIGVAAIVRRAQQVTGPVVFYVDEKGIGSITRTVETYLHWENFSVILETDKHIHFISGPTGRGYHCIYKHLIPPGTLAAIKDVLGNAPVEDKKLLT